MFDSSKERAIWKEDVAFPVHVEAITQSVEELFSLKSNHVPKDKDKDTSAKKSGKV